MTVIGNSLLGHRLRVAQLQGDGHSWVRRRHELGKCCVSLFPRFDAGSALHGARVIRHEQRMLSMN
jgi:hypothetical protein